MRTDPERLGELAAEETGGDESWSEPAYAFGPLSIGLTAAAVNEASQYCEDLFALLHALRETEYFAQKMSSYSAGKVTGFGHKLGELDDDSICRLFLVPDVHTIESGLADGKDPEASIASFRAGRTRLCERVRDTASFYAELEDIHLNYKHGLKLALTPVGAPLPEEEIKRRRSSVETPVFAYTAEPIGEMMRKPKHQNVMMMRLGETQQANVRALVEERNLLRFLPPRQIDFDHLVEKCALVLQLLQIAQENRVGVGKLDESGNQRVCLPGPELREQLTVTFRSDSVIGLGDFAGP